MRSPTQELTEGIRNLAHITLCKATHLGRPSTKASNLMKTRRILLALSAVALVLSSASLIAGPGPQFWNRATPVTTTKDADALKPDDTVVMVCGACKTVLVRESKHVGPAGKGSEQWFTIGTKHQCGHCGGEMSVVKGKTTDSMQHNCTMCGEGAAFCCAVKSDDTAAKK